MVPKKFVKNKGILLVNDQPLSNSWPTLRQRIKKPICCCFFWCDVCMSWHKTELDQTYLGIRKLGAILTLVNKLRRLVWVSSRSKGQRERHRWGIETASVVIQILCTKRRSISIWISWSRTRDAQCRQSQALKHRGSPLCKLCRVSFGHSSDLDNDSDLCGNGKICTGSLLINEKLSLIEST